MRAVRREWDGQIVICSEIDLVWKVFWEASGIELSRELSGVSF
jgi:hypothetical protein